MKICLCTWYNDGIKEYADPIYENNKEYANLHNYDIIKCSKRRLSEKEYSWEKLPFIEELLNKNYDYIIWIDADAIIHIDSPPLENVIKEHVKYNFIFSGDAFIRLNNNTEFTQKLVDINCGIFFVKNTNYSKNLIRHWYQHTYEQLHPIWWEQNNMIYMIKNNILDIQNNCYIIPYNILQYFTEDHKKFFYIKKYGLKDKAFVFHMAGSTKEYRLNIVNKIL